MAADLDIYGEPTSLPILMTVTEVADLLRVSTKAVYDMVRRGQLPGARKVGGSWRFHRDKLLDWIAGESES